MYHPELYPELASKNQEFEKLHIPSEAYYKKSKKFLAQNNSENIENINNNNINNNTINEVIIEDVIKSGQEKKVAEKSANYLKAFRKAIKEKGNFKPELASNFHLIDSIKEEINQTGEIYLGVNNFQNRSEIIDNYMHIFEAQKKFSFFEFNENTKKLEDEKFNITSHYSPSVEVEKNRANYLNNSAPLLEDLIEELKSQNRINSTTDLSGIPSTENAYGKPVKNPEENLQKIKEYFDKVEMQKAKKFVNKAKKNSGPNADKKSKKNNNNEKKMKNKN